MIHSASLEELAVRYQKGDTQAWDDLLELEAMPEVIVTGVRIAHMMMTIVRKNLELLIPRLIQHGFQLGAVEDGPKYWADTPPLLKQWGSSDVQLALKERGGPAVSLQTFYALVGGVNLIGFHPDWPVTEVLDPLFIQPASADMATAIREGDLFNENESRLDLSPDALHKANISGGPAYGIICPTGPIEAMWVQGEEEMQFVAYLREAILECGGLPGLLRLESHNVPLEDLTLGLIPF